MKKWWIVALAAILFAGGVVWKVIDVKTCTDERGIVIAPLTGHQECVRR